MNTTRRSLLWSAVAVAALSALPLQAQQIHCPSGSPGVTITSNGFILPPVSVEVSG